MGGFDVPVIVPVLGTLVCSSLVAMRLYEAFTGVHVPGKSPPYTAPLLALVIVGMIVSLYYFVRPKAVVEEE